MGRPPMPLGTWGKVRTYELEHNKRGKPIKVKAVADFRDYDGVVRQVKRNGRNVGDAENRLRIAMKERAETGRAGMLSAADRFETAAKLWFGVFAEQVAEGEKSPGSLETYERIYRRHVLPAVGQLRLGEASTPLFDKFLRAVKKGTGAATAKTCRAIVSNVMNLAVRYGAIRVNPVREAERIAVRGKRKPRALTAEERAAFLDRLRAHEPAMERDLPDLTEFMMGTGARIGESLAVMWSEVNLDDGTVHITSTISRITGKGLVRRPTKSRAGDRVLGLPAWALVMLQRRHAAGIELDAPVFPTLDGEWWDPNNARKYFRHARGETDFCWVVPHSFRKTTATVLDDAGLSARFIADQLGHAKPSMTQDVYMARGRVNPANVEALDAWGVTGTEENRA